MTVDFNVSREVALGGLRAPSLRLTIGAKNRTDACQENLDRGFLVLGVSIERTDRRRLESSLRRRASRAKWR